MEMIHLLAYIRRTFNDEFIFILSKDCVPSGLEINCIRIRMHHKITLSLISLQPTFQKSETRAIASSKGSGLIYVFKNFNGELIVSSNKPL